jgi:hypothetical protein
VAPPPLGAKRDHNGTRRPGATKVFALIFLWTAASLGGEGGVAQPRVGYSRRSPPPDPPFEGCSSTRLGGTFLGRSHERWFCAPVSAV